MIIDVNMYKMRAITVIIVTLLLMILSIEDIKTKKIHLSGTILILLVSIWGNIYTREPWDNVLCTAIVAAILLPITFAFRKSIGMGDTLTFIALTMTAGENILVVALIATLTMSVVSIILLILKKANKTTRLPFVPCILVGYIVKVVLVLC